jgi:hypothetical protein
MSFALVREIFASNAGGFLAAWGAFGSLLNYKNHRRSRWFFPLTPPGYASFFSLILPPPEAAELALGKAKPKEIITSFQVADAQRTGRLEASSAIHT